MWFKNQYRQKSAAEEKISGILSKRLRSWLSVKRLPLFPAIKILDIVTFFTNAIPIFQMSRPHIQPLLPQTTPHNDSISYLPTVSQCGELSLSSRNSNPEDDNILQIPSENHRERSTVQSCVRESTRDCKLQECSDISLILAGGIQCARQANQREEEITKLIDEYRCNHEQLVAQVQELLQFNQMEQLISQQQELTKQIVAMKGCIRSLKSDGFHKKIMPKTRLEHIRVQELKEQIGSQRKLFTRQKNKINTLDEQIRTIELRGKNTQSKMINKINSIRSVRKGALFRRADDNLSNSRKHRISWSRRRLQKSPLHLKNEGENQYGLQPLEHRIKAKSRYSFLTDPEEARKDLLLQRISLLKQSKNLAVSMGRRTIEQLSFQNSCLSEELMCIEHQIGKNYSKLGAFSSIATQEAIPREPSSIVEENAVVYKSQSENLKNLAGRRLKITKAPAKDQVSSGSSPKEKARIKSAYEIELGVYRKSKLNSRSTSSKISAEGVFARSSEGKFFIPKSQDEVTKEYFENRVTSAQRKLLSKPHLINW